MTTLHKPIDGKCAVCGDSDFTLAEDHTAYGKCEWNAATQQFESSYAHTETSGAEDSVRFFCASCGTGHQVPEELP